MRQANENVKIIEELISTLIYTSFKERLPSEGEFLSMASMIKKNMGGNYPVTEEEFCEILRRLREKFLINMDLGVYINDRNNGHQSWLPAKRAKYDFFYWNRYRQYLEVDRHWNPRMTVALGKISDEILDLCGDPEESRFAIRGLILGDVQSGKTINYTAVCNKAADTGYRIIIILAGTQENLRNQTQGRLDEEFIGRNSTELLNPRASQGIKCQPLGVGRFGSAKKIAAFTSRGKDFDSAILKSNNLGLENVNCPVILVVKKNRKILSNLITWLSSNNNCTINGPIGLPLLLIDDEADNASINTQDPDAAPTAINGCIRRLLSLFSKTTYLGVTATPFANIFIDPDNAEDLFPADFIYALSAPSNYIGADRIFGDGGDCAGILEMIEMTDFGLCLPAKHKKDFIVQKLPEDLYEAANYFLLVNAIRDLRGDKTEHRSMMVHISLYTNVQNQIAEMLDVWLDGVKSDLRNYALLDGEEIERIVSLRILHTVWNKYHLDDVCMDGWEVILREYLYEAVAPIEVRAVNMKTGAASLDFASHNKDGFRVIAVGGNSLSRGMTLEGLCVTYFYRNTRMYDTLMQMGRWFGYRPNYQDLVKVWMSVEAIDWYGQITRATTELKDEILAMRNAHQTPMEFGLKVRQDPGALIVTARNKMKTATEISRPISVSGRLLETPRLKHSKSVLMQNEVVFKTFVSHLSASGMLLKDSERSRGNLYWEHVSSEIIARLLRDFETHPWHLSFNGRALAEYIEAKTWRDGWDVVLISRGEGRAYPGGVECEGRIFEIKTEKRRVLVEPRMLSISKTKVRVGSGGCTKIGLTDEEIAAIERNFHQTSGKQNVSDKVYLVRGRRPILMLHILEPDYDMSRMTDDEDISLPDFLYALGVGFPNDGETLLANYKVNLVELRNWIDDQDMYDECDI